MQIGLEQLDWLIRLLLLPIIIDDFDVPNKKKIKKNNVDSKRTKSQQQKRKQTLDTGRKKKNTRRKQFDKFERV